MVQRTDPRADSRMFPTPGANMQNIIAKDFYTYATEFSSIAAGASSSQNISIQADSDFMVQKLTYFADVAGAAQTDANRVVPLVNVTITATSSGRQLMNISVPVPLLFGTGELPFILPQPKVFPARSTVNFVISNFSAATTYRVSLAMVGAKLFAG